MSHASERVLLNLSSRSGIDFFSYRDSMITRRLGDRIAATESATIDDYLDLLDRVPTEYDALLDACAINVSGFFRESHAFSVLEAEVLPGLVRDGAHAGGEPVRVWSAGCANGEEAYSAAILLTEFMTRERLSVPLEIFGTDIALRALERARAGLYSPESLREIKFGLVNKYFTREEGMYRVAEPIRSLVRFSLYDLLTRQGHAPPDSVFGGFDIIFCRNVLIYFKPAPQGAVFAKLMRALRPGGVIVLGATEVPPSAMSGRVRRQNEHCSIFTPSGSTS